MSGAKSRTEFVPADVTAVPDRRRPAGARVVAGVLRVLLVAAVAIDVDLVIAGSASVLTICLVGFVPAAVATVAGSVRAGLVRRPRDLLVVVGAAMAVAGHLSSVPAVEVTGRVGELAAAAGMTMALLAGAKANGERDHLGRLWLEAGIVAAALTAWFVVVLPGSDPTAGGFRDALDHGISPVTSVLVLTPVVLLLARLRSDHRRIGPSLLVGSAALLWGGLVAGPHPLDAAGWKSDALLITVLVAAAGIGAAALDPSITAFADGTARWRRPRDWARTATLLLVPALAVAGVASQAQAWNDAIWPLLVLVSIVLLAVRTRLTADHLIARTNGRRSAADVDVTPLDLETLLTWALAVHPDDGADLDIAVIAAVPAHQLNGLDDQPDDPASGIGAEAARRIREVMRGAENLDPFWRGEWALCLDRGRFLVVHLRSAGPAGGTRENQTTSAELLAGSLDRWLVLPFRAEPGDLRVDFTIGYTVGTMVPGSDAARSHVQNAILAAQHGQPGQAQKYDATTRASSGRRARLAAALEDSLLDGTDLAVVFEPMVDVRTGRPVGAEAQTRWRGPDGSPISPDELGAVADQARARLDLGEWQLNAACAAASVEFIQREIAVNVSAPELLDPALYSRVMRSLDVHQIDPAMLVLEISESLVNTAVESAANELRRLAAVGIKLSIDDFRNRGLGAVPAPGDAVVVAEARSVPGAPDDVGGFQRGIARPGRSSASAPTSARRWSRTGLMTPRRSAWSPTSAATSPRARCSAPAAPNWPTPGPTSDRPVTPSPA